MSQKYEEITPELVEWIERQRMFFVATAPLSADGLVNCSPKGLDTFRILGPREVAYLDLTGSGVETIAHLRENGRIVVMFCGFEGPPKIVRLHGRGTIVLPEDDSYATLKPRFPDMPAIRSIIRVEVARVSDSCGFGVPRMVHKAERDQLTRYALSKGEAGMAEYRAKKNAQSVDGLPGIDVEKKA